MKQFISFTLASFLGAAVAILYNNNTVDTISDAKPVAIEKVWKEPQKNKIQVHNNGTTTQPVDFVDAAEAAMPAVVNITSITEYKPKKLSRRTILQIFWYTQTI